MLQPCCLEAESCIRTEGLHCDESSRSFWLCCELALLASVARTAACMCTVRERAAVHKREREGERKRERERERDSLQ